MNTKHQAWWAALVLTIALVASTVVAQVTEEVEEATRATEEATEEANEAVEGTEEAVQEAEETAQEAEEGAAEAVQEAAEAEQEAAEAAQEAEETAQEAEEAEQAIEQGAQQEDEAAPETEETAQEAPAPEEEEGEVEEVPELDTEPTNEEFEDGDELTDGGEVPPEVPAGTLPENAHIRIGRVGSARGGMRPQAFMGAVQSRGTWIRQCYAAALERNGDAAGVIVIRGTSGGGGQFHHVRVQTNTTGDDELGQCVVQAIDSIEMLPRQRQHRRTLPQTHFRIPIRFWTE
ncbi:MAG: hypothetical protein JW797_16225 [Bradymonadales bacterium]|nr:hypothetical protein [Bradymonadales bacterium]